VLLMPAHIPPHKSAMADPGPEHRLAMCALAVAGEVGLSVSPLEIERGGPSYTVDTLRDIHASDPDAELTFIVGADIARTLPEWREPAEILQLARLAVAARGGCSPEDVLETVASVSHADGGPRAGGDRATPEVRFLALPVMDVSSSAIRGRVARGEPVEQLVGSAVAGYIAEHGLYRPRLELGG
jgi:nicotinate-nucleotide adenylyltransferase